MKKSLISLLVLFWMGFSVRGGECVAVKAYVDKNVLGVNESLHYKIEISDTGVLHVPDPQIPDVPGFDVAGRSTSSNFYFSNPTVSISNVYTYTLVPKQKGKFTIPPLSITIDNTAYRTSPIQVEVTDPVRPVPTSPSVQQRRKSLFDEFDDLLKGEDSLFPREKRRLTKEDLFVRMEVNKTDAVVGEEVLMTFSFYRSIPIWGNPTYIPPSLAGFLSEDIPLKGTQKDFVQILNGRKYTVSVLKSAIFPVQSGKILIQPARLQVQIDPFPDSVELQTDPILLNVSPFPGRGKPSSFTGLVGQFSMSIKVDKQESQTDQPVTAVVTVRGKGNIKAIPTPLKPDLPQFDSFDPETSESVEKTDSGFQGFKEFKYVLIPRAEGNLEIPPFRMSFFNPEKGSYETVQTDPVPVKVKAGAKESQSLPSPGRPRGPIQKLRSDILFIKPDQKFLSDQGQPIPGKPLLFVVLVGPALFWVGFYMVLRKQHRLTTDIGYARGQRATRLAKKRLSEAREKIGTGQSVEFYAAVDNAVREFIADKWNIPAPSLTNEIIEEILNETNGNVSERIRELLGHCAYARFAPVGRSESEMEESFRTASEIIGQLDKQI